MAEQQWNRMYFWEWVEREGLDLIRGTFVEDVYTVPLKPWPRVNGSAVQIQLDGTGEMNSAYVCEIPPGKQLEPIKHLYDEIVYVLSGRGSTSVWYEGKRRNSFEWKAGSLFAVPLNAWHQHFNGSGREPVRYVAVTTAPLMLNLIRNDDFIFNNPAVFPERYDSEEEYFSGEMRWATYTGWDLPRPIVFSNLYPDIPNFPLRASDRAKGARGQSFELDNGVLAAHTTEIPGRSFSTVHRHGPGAHVLWLKGEGYTLMWPDGGEKVKVDWKPGAMVVPPNWWWHQHAVVGAEPAQDLALRFSAITNQIHKLGEDVMKSTRQGGNQLMIDDFPPDLREELTRIFEEECAKRGAAPRLDVKVTV